MKNFISFAIALIVSTTAQADLVVNSVGDVVADSIYVDYIKFNGTTPCIIRSNISNEELVFDPMGGLYYRDYPVNSFYMSRRASSCFAVGTSKEKPSAFFYNATTAPAILAQTNNSGGTVFSGWNGSRTTSYILADGTIGAAGGFVSISDQVHKNNIQTVTNALDGLNDLNAVSYILDVNSTNSESMQLAPRRNITSNSTSEPELETTSFYEPMSSTVLEAMESERQRPKYGFIAQEIEKIFPNVVYTMPTGEKGIAYQELIPILVSAIQEQQAEIEVLTTQIEELKTPATQQRQQAPAAMQDAITDGSAVLMQNTPNPFNQATEIGYRLPEGSATALIMVCDMNGKMLQTYPLAVNSTNGTLTIQAGSYTPGMYLYTLIIDGVQIDTKQMIILAH